MYREILRDRQTEREIETDRERGTNIDIWRDIRT